MNRKSTAAKISLLAALAAAGVFSLNTGARAADPGFCSEYARQAVHEADVLSRLPCFRGFDIRWHRDYRLHYGWCLRNSYEAADSERGYRRMRLAQCEGR
jgi:hypothetical protein